MVGLLGYAVAGAAQGAGESIAAQALARREAALEEVRTGRVTAAEIRRQKFQTSEREASQDFQLKRDQLKAASAAPKPPKVAELFDKETGLPYKAQFNEKTGGWDRIGGTKAPSKSGVTVNVGGGKFGDQLSKNLADTIQEQHQAARDAASLITTVNEG